MGGVFGFTGEIGSGKTAAARLLHEAAAPASGLHVEFSDGVIDLAHGWMERIGVVQRVGAAEIDALQQATRSVFGVRVPRAALSEAPTAELAAYLESFQGLAAEQRDISVATKDLHRPLLQWLGHSYVTHVNPEFWNDVVRAKIENGRAAAALVTVGGVRYPQNADILHEYGGYVVKVIRPDSSSAAQGHTSESGIPDSHVDTHVLNNGSLEHLAESMTQLWNDANGGAVQPQY